MSNSASLELQINQELNYVNDWLLENAFVSSHSM